MFESFRFLIFGTVLLLCICDPLFARTWTDKEERTLDAEYLDFVGGEVKVRRTSDQRIFWLRYGSLSADDQEFVNQKIAEKRSEDVVALRQRNEAHITPKKKAESVPEQLADRSLIPALIPKEIAHDYPNGPTCLMNFFVWWNESEFPGLLPSEDRDSAVARIDSILESYSGNSIGGLATGVRRFSEKQLDAHRIDVSSGAGPTVEKLEKGAQGWNGMVLLLGLYEKNGSQWKRKGGRFVSLVSVTGNRIIFNYKGNQYTGTVSSFELETLDKEHQRYFDFHGAVGVLEFSEIARPDSALIPKGYCALLDSALTMTPYLLEEVGK